MVIVEIKCRRLCKDMLLWTVRWWAKMNGEKRREHRPDVLRASEDGVSRIVTLRKDDSVNNRVQFES